MKQTGLLLAACLTAALATTAVAARQGPPQVRILSPEAGSMVTARCLLRAEIAPPPAEPVRVFFYVDGQIVCGPIERPPYECQWDAGVGIKRHQIRVVARLEGGRPLVAAVTTREAEFTDNARVDLVRVPVIVKDGGRYVTGLTKKDFRITEDGVEQPISFCLSADAQLDLLVAIDVSGSMTAAMPKVKAAVKQFLTTLRSSDRVSGVAFNDNTMTLWRPESDLAARLRAVDLLEPWGATSLYDVLVRSVEMLGAGEARQALVFFTDGDDTSSHLTRQELDLRAERTDASLFLIAQGRGVETPELKDVLEHIAGITGGRAFFPDKIDKLPGVFADIEQDLSHQYVITYPPPTDDYNSHTLKVKVSNGKWKVHARTSRRREQRKGGQ